MILMNNRYIRMMILMKNILILGYYGFGNTGDEAMLISILDSLRCKSSEIDFTVLSNKPVQTSKNYNVKAVSWLAPMGEIVRIIDDCDLLILGGGAIIDDCGYYNYKELLCNTEYFNVFVLNVILLAFLRSKKSIALGISVVPCEDQTFQKHVKLIMNTCSAIFVRDELSKKILISFGCLSCKIKVIHDVAFGLKNCTDERLNEIFKQEKIKIYDNMISVSLMNYDIGNKYYLQIINELSEFITRENYLAIIIPFYKEYDFNNIECIKEYLYKINKNIRFLDGKYTPSEISGIMSKCKIHVGMRFHSIVFSLKNSIPCISIICNSKSYINKISDITHKFELEKYTFYIDKLNEKDIYMGLYKLNKDHNSIMKNIVYKKKCINKEFEMMYSKIIKDLNKKSRFMIFKIYFILKNLNIMNKKELVYCRENMIFKLVNYLKDK